MSCLISKGKLLACKDQRGGIKNIYFANYQDYSFVIAAHAVTSLGSLDEVFKYEVKATTNALTETGTSSEDNGTFLNAQSLAVTLPKLGTDLQAQVQLICLGRPYVFIEDYNGNVLLVGATNGTMANCTKASGGAGGDLSGYTLTITAEEGNLSPFLDATAKTALQALVSDVVVS
jgi:hypothetical protein